MTTNSFSDIFSGLNAELAGNPTPAAPEPSPAPVFMRDIALAGGAAEGSGAITGWAGLGSLTRTQIVDALAQAELPAAWAPGTKSAVGYAGRVVSSLNNRGYISRRAGRATWEKATEIAKPTREYRARWTVAANAASTADVGDALGSVVLTVELHDGSDDLHVKGDEELAQHVIAEYEGKRDAEVFAAGDVTSWLSSVLVRECSAARFGIGYYIPAATRDIAERLVTSIAALWGRSWISPLLPVATSAELQQGIARGFTDEIAAVSRKLVTEREAARKKKLTEITAATAARLLRDLSDVDARAEGYRVLCGAEALAPAAAQLRALTGELSKLADDATIRFSMLELDPSTAVPVVEAPSVAEKAADNAPKAAERSKASPERAAVAPVVAKPTVEDYRARYRNAQEHSGLDTGTFRTRCAALFIAPLSNPATPSQWADAAETVARNEKEIEAPAPTPEPAAPSEPVNEATSDRFSMLELD
jgi:hypothetical protein